MRLQHHTRSGLLAVAGLFVAGSFAHAQSQPAPKLNHIFPMGGQAGTTLELKVTGIDIAKADSLHFSIPDVKVEPVGGAESVEIKPDPKKKGQPKPPTALQARTFKVTLPAKAPLGIHDVRVVSKGGVSNPRAFVVGDMKEHAEKEPNDDTDKADKIELNSIANGVIAAPTDVDYYAFTGKKGQRVIVSCLSTSIDSKLPAAIELYAKGGAYYGMSRNYHNNDALIDATLPDDGEYLVRVFSFTHQQGGVDYFYRLQVGTMPWIDAVYPPAVEPGKEAQVTILGRNLPGGKPDPASVAEGRVLDRLVVTVKAPADAKARQRLAYTGHVPPVSTGLDGFEYRVRNDAGSSNPALVTFAEAPVVIDDEKNDTRESAQKVMVPCEIAGRVEKRGDVDWYAFTAKKGEPLSIEALGDRIGSSLDLFFQVVNDKGTTLTEQDDTAEIISPQLYTRTDDPPRYRFSPPADGTYYVKISSRAAFTDYGPRQRYVLRISPEHPDFRVVAMPPSGQFPDSSVVGQHGNYAFHVFVWRHDGFTGDIGLIAEKLPPGVTMKPQIISSSQKHAVFVVSADDNAPPYVGPITILATATVKGQNLVREVRAATITWAVPAPNTPTLTRLDRELVLAVRDKSPYALTVDKDHVTIVQGEKANIPLKLKALQPDFKTNVQLAAIGLPTGTAMQPLTLAAGKESGTAVIESKGGTPLPPGNYTIVIRGQTLPINPKQPAPAMMKAGGPMNYVQVTPPVTLTVVPKQLGKLTVSPTNPKAKLGSDIELTVKFTRQFDVGLPMKVEAILPPNVKGVSAKNVTLAPGDDEVKLRLSVSPEAMANSTPAIIVRATAMFNGTVPVVHEAKVNLAISK